ncbi:pirin family protein [Aliidiomarina maris]|uniref:Pirin N-terminal domain-containing protein n=1 Tax=Aliidiomarina maris TaxID=531312 RepID=A0A327WX17_9GAMM|nr:pirin family protein [Aliidiomarina maris]RAJ96515.1 hypothetical protein B0I24_10894 [Aliidiomarina maris]RUO23738.1 hypothetical protein CWE07_09495 [Aliidiomarina maris]
MKSTMVQKRVTGMPAQDGAGVKLSRVINQPSYRHQDPFLMLDEFKSDNPNDYIAGFPPHPHRGFCTLTYMLEGRMAHEDSQGNTGEIGPGGLQWMRAARGMIHSEMPKQEDGMMWGFQLWVNLPASEKMSDPEYADIMGDQVPEVVKDGVTVRVLSGEFDNQQGPVTLYVVPAERNFLYLDARFSSAAELEVPHQGQATRLVYVYRGEVRIDGVTLRAGELGELRADGDLLIKGSAEAGMLVLAAQPIGEPVAQYGPFVMNTEDELRQAFADYQSGALTQ